MCAMTADEAIHFLARHQPMPSDRDITDEEGQTFAAVLKLFEDQPDRRAIPLLIHSVSEGTGLGMYEHIKFVLMAHDKRDVIPHLQEALGSPDAGVLYRACWWACDVGAWDLEGLVVPLLSHPDTDVADSARAFMELKDELAEQSGST
jgi:hypothetical protein